MSRIQPVKEEQASDSVKEMYQNLKKALGRVPNIFLNMGNSDAVLSAFMKLNECAEHTSLPQELREQIALVIAQTNRCDYCLSAHSAIAKSLGIQEPMILQARKGEAPNKKATAILQFVKQCVEKKGTLDDREVQALKTEGVTDKELVEIILLLTLNMFTNYFNKITGTDVDFPLAPKI